MTCQSVHSYRPIGARIYDLEAEGFVFEAKRQGGDYVYRLISINGEPYRKPGVTTDEDVRIAQSAVEMFEIYQPRAQLTDR